MHIWKRQPLNLKDLSLDQFLRGSKRKYNNLATLKTKEKTKKAILGAIYPTALDFREWRSEGRMGSLSINWEGFLPKSRYIIDIMNELREKVDLVGKGLDSGQKDAQSTNDKSQKDGYGGGNYSDHSRSSRSFKEERRERHERNRREEMCERHDRRKEDRMNKLDISKCKTPSFLGNCKLEFYIDWELKVEQVVTSQKGVWWVTLAFGDFSLIWWWTTMLDHIRRGIYGLKRLMRIRFVPCSYARNLHNKLQILYQESKSMEEYHKEMEIDLLRDQLRESEEANMARFLHGLNRKI
ncbi:hypothetical protein CR513_06787, partial [Mucuna pruriens]